MSRRLLISLALAAATAAGATEDFQVHGWGGPPGSRPDEAVERLLAAHVEGGWDAGLRWPDFGAQRGEVGRFYARRAWSLAWLADDRPTDAAWQLAGALGGAAGKGLDPRDYGAETLEPLLGAAERGEVSAAERIRLDVALTVSALRYAGDLALGRVRPAPGTRLLGRPQIARSAGPPPDLVAVLERAVEAVDPGAVLATVEPDWPPYRRTLRELDAWRRRAGAAPPPPLPAPPDPPIAPEGWSGRDLLAGRLGDLGDLPDWEAEEDEAACRAPLSEALARFQRRHGLEPTGLVDAPTVRELEAPPERRIAQLVLALERWRWMPRRPPSAWIVVNVPEFALHAGDGEGELRMRVVVGQAYERGTPLLAASVAQVVLRPPWSVPLSIQQEELVPRVATDRAFVADQDFEVLDATERPVPPTATPDLLAGLRSGALRLRQRPGAGNALGLVKVALSGPAWLYLHGTPGAALFARTRRDLSHGCIRVEEPVRLAAWILRAERGWSPAAVEAAIRGDRTLEVDVTRPIAVLIGYFTAAGWEEGGFGFYEDVYGQDAALATALREEGAQRGTGRP